MATIRYMVTPPVSVLNRRRIRGHGRQEASTRFPTRRRHVGSTVFLQEEECCQSTATTPRISRPPRTMFKTEGCIVGPYFYRLPLVCFDVRQYHRNTIWTSPRNGHNENLRQAVLEDVTSRCATQSITRSLEPSEFWVAEARGGGSFGG